MTGPARLFAIALALAAASSSSGRAEAPGKALGRPAKIRPAEGTAAQEARVSVLVRLADGTDHEPLRGFARGHGARVAREYSILPNVMNVRDLPEGAIAALERIHGVESVQPDGIVRLHLNQSTPLIHALKSEVETAGFSANGNGVRVCVIDTGIDPNHVMYADRVDVPAGRDFVNGDGDPADDHGHGTHVAGIAAGGDGNTIDFGCAGEEPFQGVGWEATVIGVKVIDALGFGTESDLITGIDYCADQTASGGRADVINLSIGAGNFSGVCDGDLVAAAANAAVDAGIVVVASSGNSGELNALASPACGSKVIAVGATYDDQYPDCEWPFPQCWEWCLEGDGLCGCLQSCSDCAPGAGEIACFSNQSLQIDVVAPGCVTASANYLDPTGAEYMCGTSMAAPHVSGLAALLLSQNPSLIPALVRQAIRDGALDRGAAGYDRAYGYGLVNAVDSLGVLACGGTCDDGNSCTVDSCDPAEASCTNDEISTCGPADGCCPSGCATGDPDCCKPLGSTCSAATECCSQKCRGGKCR